MMAAAAAGEKTLTWAMMGRVMTAATTEETKLEKTDMTADTTASTWCKGEAGGGGGRGDHHRRHPPHLF